MKATSLVIALSYTSNTGYEVGNVSTFVTLASALVGLAWYSHKINRPMLKSELLRFAFGITITDILLSVTLIVTLILWQEEALSLQNVGLMLGFDEAGFATSDLVVIGFLGIFSSLFTFVLTYIIARLITKRLPRTMNKMH